MSDTTAPSARIVRFAGQIMRTVQLEDPLELDGQVFAAVKVSKLSVGPTSGT